MSLTTYEAIIILQNGHEEAEPQVLPVQDNSDVIPCMSGGVVAVSEYYKNPCYRNVLSI